jgi:hypothetical protein
MAAAAAAAAGGGPSMTCPNSIAFHKTLTKFDEFMEALDQFEYALADSGLGGGVQEKIERVLRDGYPTEEGVDFYVERRNAIINMYLPGRKTKGAKRARCGEVVDGTGAAQAEIRDSAAEPDEVTRCTACGWSMAAPRHTHRTKPCLQCSETDCTEDCVVHNDEDGKVIAMFYCAVHSAEKLREMFMPPQVEPAAKVEAAEE